MIHKRRFHLYFPDIEFEAFQLRKFDMSRHFLHRNREVRALHLNRKSRFQSLPWPFKSQNSHPIPLIVRRREKWKPLDVIPVRMRDQNSDVNRMSFELFPQLLSKSPNPGPGIENDQL